MSNVAHSPSLTAADRESTGRPASGEAAVQTRARLGGMLAAADAIDRFIRAIGRVVCWSNLVLVGVIILQVVLRYGFSHGMVVLEELQWHLYALGIMIGLSYAMTEDNHTRVDILHMHFSKQTKAKWEIFGIVVFLIPFLYTVLDQSLPFVYDAWRINEHSDAPTGLPWRWAVKSLIPIAFALLSLSTVSRFLRSVAALRGEE